MLVLRFQRTGRENIPSFRLVLAEKTAAAKGKVQEYLGHYLPARTPHVFTFERERVEHWLKAGAQPSETLARLLKKEGIQNLDRYIRKYTKQKKKSEALAEAPTSAPGGAAEAPKKKDDTAEKKE
jgi:small subunit ribosomal protein S16